MTAPQPSSNALPMTLAFVPGGPEPMTKGFGNLRPLTVTSSDAMRRLRSNGTALIFHDAARAEHQEPVDHKRDREGDKPGISIDADPALGYGVEQMNRREEPRHAGSDGDD